MVQRPRPRRPWNRGKTRAAAQFLSERMTNLDPESHDKKSDDLVDESSSWSKESPETIGWISGVKIPVLKRRRRRRRRRRKTKKE